MFLQIKNMVCPRCISSVRQTLNTLGIPYLKIELGKVELETNLSDKLESSLELMLIDQGFELLNTEQSKLINTVKSYIINKIHYSEEESSKSLSSELSNFLTTDYSIISKTFSRVEGITIEHYFMNQRIEKVKELLSYEEKSISEIAFELGFSSVSHLSFQFKKITGRPPSAYKNEIKNSRKSIDEV